MVGISVSGVMVLAAGCSGLDNHNEVIQALDGPYRAIAYRDARMLCKDFTATVAERLALTVTNTDSCEKKVAQVFSDETSLESRQWLEVGRHVIIGHISQRGNNAKVVISYANQPNVRFQVLLERTGGRWRIATLPVFAVLNNCVSKQLPAKCHGKTHLLWFTMGSLQHSAAPLIKVPLSMIERSNQERQEFMMGSRVAVNTGCLACHRIDQRGNIGPGSPLTDIGSRLNKMQLRAALLHTAAPMPAYKYLPDSEQKSLVTFLSLLR